MTSKWNRRNRKRRIVIARRMNPGVDPENGVVNAVPNVRVTIASARDALSRKVVKPTVRLIRSDATTTVMLKTRHREIVNAETTTPTTLSGSDQRTAATKKLLDAVETEMSDEKVSAEVVNDAVTVTIMMAENVTEKAPRKIVKIVAYRRISVKNGKSPVNGVKYSYFI